MAGLPKVGTIGDYVALKHDFNLTCGSCRHHVLVVSDEVAERYGADLPLQDYWLRLRCQECGSRRVSLSVQPRTKEYGRRREP